jgi:hypothetical protein
MFNIFNIFKEAAIREKEKGTLLFVETTRSDFQIILDKYGHLIRISSMSSIPAGKIYYEYIGGGKFIQQMKFLPSEKTSPLMPKISLELDQRVSDFTNWCGESSEKYEAKDIMSLVFKQAK